MRILILIIIYVFVWISLWAEINFLALISMPFAIAFVIYVSYKLEFLEDIAYAKIIKARFAIYLLWLFKEMTLAGLLVSREILLIKPQMQPKFIHFKHNLDKEIEITLLASSITLTPSTITVDALSKSFTVHSLFDESAKEMAESHMIQKIEKLV